MGGGVGVKQGGEDESNQLGRLTPLQNMSLGILAGAASKVVNYPLIFFKNSTQQGLPLSINPRVVYRGLPMGMINMGGTTGTQFVLCGMFQKLLSGGDSTQMTPQKEVLAALLGGAVSGIPNSMYELIMIQQQRFGGNMIGTGVKVYGKYGVGGLLRGLSPTIGREGFFTMAMLGTVPVLHTYLREGYEINDNVALGVASLTGSLSACVFTQPFDTIKTCMQGDVKREKFGDIVATVRNITAESVTGLWRGLQYRAALITTSFFLVNKVKQFLQPRIFSMNAPKA